MGENTSRTWRENVKEKFSRLEAILDSERYLEYEIRAAEELINKERKTLGLHEKPYKIVLKMSSSLPQREGRAFPYENGADLRCTTKGTRHEKLVIVGHELAHIYLKHSYYRINAKPQTRDEEFISGRENVEATYFAKLISKRRAARYRKGTFLEERNVSDRTIDTVAMEVDPAYNEDYPDDIKDFHPGITK